MSRLSILILTLVATSFANTAFAQDGDAKPGFVEVTYMPAGAAFFTSESSSPSFGNSNPQHQEQAVAKGRPNHGGNARPTALLAMHTRLAVTSPISTASCRPGLSSLLLQNAGTVSPARA